MEPPTKEAVRNAANRLAAQMTESPSPSQVMEMVTSLYGEPLTGRPYARCKEALQRAYKRKVTPSAQWGGKRTPAGGTSYAIQRKWVQEGRADEIQPPAIAKPKDKA